jgi:archaellum biogenesis ATPase FlaH
MSVTNTRLILSALNQNEAYLRKCIPFIQEEYFRDSDEQKVFQLTRKYVTEYNRAPNKAALEVIARADETITEDQTDSAIAVINDIFDIIPPENDEWLLKMSEEFCRDAAIHNAIDRAITIYQGEDAKLTAAAIPDILQKAIGVSFDTRVGMDMMEDGEARWDYYTNPETKIPFDMDIFNEVTCGGIPRKTLNLIAAGINVGKTMTLVALACMYLKQGLNVVYFSNEMSEFQIGERMDANLLKVNIADIVSLGKDKFIGRVDKLKQMSYGRLKVKEYPPMTANVTHFRNALNELKTKQNFAPDVIIIDYLQITASASMKSDAGSYFYYKSVAQELRALAITENVILWSAVQFTRGGMGDTDAGMEDIGESAGIPQAADGMWSITRTEELDQMCQLMIKQLKSRYADKSVRMRFTIGVDVNKQTLFGVEQTDNNEMTNPETVERKTPEQLRNKFLGIKVA